MFLGWKLAGTRCRQEGLRAGRRSARYGEVQEHRLPLCKRASSTTRRMWWAPTALLVLQMYEIACLGSRMSLLQLWRSYTEPRLQFHTQRARRMRIGLTS
ncbi:hypothetical protein BST61_g10232 [Cercospora zeina]